MIVPDSSGTVLTDGKVRKIKRKKGKAQGIKPLRRVQSGIAHGNDAKNVMAGYGLRLQADLHPNPTFPSKYESSLSPIPEKSRGSARKNNVRTQYMVFV